VTEHIVRTEKRHTEGDRYPQEIAITAAGTWIIPDYHLGRWTNRVAGAATASSARTSNGRFTLDDLNASVVAIALQKGWPLTDESEALMSVYDSRDGDLPPSASVAAVELAARAVAWLNEARAPEGRHFVLEDALYLIEDADQGE
jgi:hypothetical protein